MAKSIFRYTFLLVIWLSILCLFACEKKADNRLEDITYRLKWLYNTSVVGDLYADVQGIFENHGLRVAIKEGSPERDAIKELELGHAHFGVASADQVIRAQSKGAPIVVIAQLFQENPLQWIFRPDKVAIADVHDLKGKKVGVTFGGNDETIMKALLTKYGLTSDDVSLFSVRYDYTPFYQGKVDLWPVYQNAQGIIIGEKLRKAGENIDFFRPAIFNVRFVANSVVTTRHMVEKRPRTVQQFVSALMKGWREALRPINAEKAVATIQRFDQDTPIGLIRKQLEATRALIKPSEDTVIGSIDVEAWAQTEKIMIGQRLIPGPVLIERSLKQGFLNALD
jgi:NitT/TauT family transport system substrate-binding protein